MEATCKTKIPQMPLEDSFAWHYEKSGCFSVRSAYKLCVELCDLEKGGTGSSTRPDGSRPALKRFWLLKVPQKIKVFAWRLIHGGLATRVNKRVRNLETISNCEVCGMEDEDEHHAVVRCDLAAVLRAEMRKSWNLPLEEEFRFTRPEWLLELVGHISPERAVQVLLLLWRSWYSRNEVVHGKGIFIMGSVKF